MLCATARWDESEEIFVFITPAYAQAASGATQTDTLLTFLPMVAIFAVFYFMLIRPQQKKAKEARNKLESLEEGNEIVTAGGIVGRITKLTDQYAVVEVANGVEMTVQRGAISQLLPKGTIKSLLLPPGALLNESLFALEIR